jgi:signal transduction histidine kinase
MNLVNVELDDDPEEAMELLEQARMIAEEHSPERVFDIETRKSLVYYNSGDREKFIEGYKAYREGVKNGLSSVHGRTMEVYYEATMGNVDKAVELAKAELGDDGADAIVVVYEKAGRWKEAYDALKRQTEVKDSIGNVVLTNSMQGIRDEVRLYDMERKASRNRILALGAVSALLVALVVVLVYMVGTRRRHLRELRKAYDLALESDHMKTAFISNISHEVRTPLNIISGFAQVLSDPDMDIDVGERRKLAKEMTKNARLITTLVDEMLGMSLSETSVEPGDRVAVNCNEILRGIIEYAMEDVQGDVQLRLETSLADDFTIMTHEDMFRRIVASLVDNALKYTTEGKVTMLASSANGKLTITVEDTGIGIPAEEAEHIFERFVKLDAFKVGLGLGLSVCRLMTSRLGGTVVLDTTYPGPGSRFVVTLPL